MKNNNYKMTLNIDEIFPAEWYQSVTDAANYVLDNMDVPNEDVDDLILHIIDYNINKQLNEKLLVSLADNLPCYLSFVDTPLTVVFNEFKNILDVCNMCSAIKEHVIYFQACNMKHDKKSLSFWKKLVKKDYPELILSTREIKSQDCIKLTIRKK